MPLYAGLISGTSMDGIEAALLDIDNDGFKVRAATHLSYPAGLEARLRAAVAEAEEAIADLAKRAR